MMPQMHSVKVADGDKAVSKGPFNVSEVIIDFHGIMLFAQLNTIFSVILTLLQGVK
jgi:hypothetical protein